MSEKHSLQSGIRDNYSRGKLGDYPKSHIMPGSQLSVVSAYFMIYAYQALKEHLNAVGNMRFLFGDPGFLASIDLDATNPKALRIEDDNPNGAEMVKVSEARRTSGKIRSPTEPEIRAAMAKAIREVKRAADASKRTLVVAGKKWSVPK